jgi:histidinol dehydrogenase
MHRGGLLKLGGVIRVVDLRGDRAPADGRALAQALPRAEIDVGEAAALVKPLVQAVQERGADALAEQAERFDGVRPPHLRVPASELARALDQLAPRVRQALEAAIERIRRVHEAQVPPERVVQLGPGAQVAQRWVPVNRVGLYVPGGLAVYPSSVVMNVVPAQAAGVRSLAVTSPPQAANGGLPHPTILAACALLGVDEVYAAGGAGAIAMFAYGIGGLVEKVDVITGPGNLWVAAAKRLVLGQVGVDAEAGPTEIAIIADHTGDPGYVAADLISQAEHDPLAASVLITTAPELVDKVLAQVEQRAEATKHSARVRQALTGNQSAVLLVDSMEQAIRVANAYGAEHLEIHTAHPDAVAQQIHNAGAIFVGPYTPVPLGDYLAGSNHVLPTGGQSAFASGLGVMAFLKSMQQVTYDAAALAEVAPLVEVLAIEEDLPAHGEAVQARQVELAPVSPPSPERPVA